MTIRPWAIAIALGILSACMGQAEDTAENGYEQFFQEFAGGLSSQYRLPEGEDLSYWGVDKDTYFYKTLDDEGNEKPPYWTKGDFNGDGETDRCYLLFPVNAASEARMVVFVSTENGFEVVDVTEVNKRMAVSTVSILSDGDYASYAIKLSHLEGHAVVYRWNHENSEFLIAGLPEHSQ